MHPELLISLIVLAVVLAVGMAVIVLPIIALTRTKRIGELLDRVGALEREVRQLRGGHHPAEHVHSAPVFEQPEKPRVVTASGEDYPTVLPARGGSAAAATINVEAWIGGRALGWIAVVLLVFAVAFFLRHVFEHNLIGPLGRVAIGLLIGLGLCGGGFHSHRRGWWVFGQFLTSAGVVLLYLSTFASFGYYRLLPQEHAAIFLVAIIAEAVVLAILYEAPAIAIMAVVGGLLTPVLLRTDRDQYQSLFTYLAVLDAGFMVLLLFRAWPAIGSMALLGTHVLFWAWFAEHYHPEKRMAALWFQGGLFVLFLAHTILNHLWRRRLAGVEDLGRLIANAFLFALALFILVDPDYVSWRGSMAMGLALVYTVVAWLLVKTRPDDDRLVFVVVAVAMGLIATALGWQAEAAWIAVGWAIQGAALWWFGLRVGKPALLGLGVAFLALACWRLLIFDTFGAHPEPFLPLFNKYGVPATIVAFALLGAALATRRYLDGGGEFNLIAMRVLGLAGVGLLWFVLSFEVYEHFQARSAALGRAEATSWRAPQDPDRERAHAELWQEQQHLQRTAQTSLSVLWGVYAMVVLAIGFRLASRPLRWLALGLFGLTLAKVGLIDMAALAGLYRVAAFFALSVMMALAAWGYQKVSKVLVASTAKGGLP